MQDCEYLYVDQPTSRSCDEQKTNLNLQKTGSPQNKLKLFLQGKAGSACTLEGTNQRADHLTPDE